MGDTPSPLPAENAMLWPALSVLVKSSAVPVYRVVVLVTGRSLAKDTADATPRT